MSLYDEMKADRMTAMKQKDTATKAVLTTFVGDLQSQEKRGIEISDAYVVKQIKKAIESCEENLKLKNDEKFRVEISVLSEYLPQQFTEEKLSMVIDEIMAEQESPSMKTVMPRLKELHDGRYDGKMASAIVKAKL